MTYNQNNCTNLVFTAQDDQFRVSLPSGPLSSFTLFTTVQD